MKRLGLDLGTASLGWAIYDDEAFEGAALGEAAASCIESGVLVFPEGMERDKTDNLKSWAALRRQKRAARRLIYRRKLRKFLMLQALIEAQMCPLSEAGLRRWKQEGRYPLDDEAFMAWLRVSPEQNPYADRAAAAQQRVDRLTLGRALYHMAQRRGFKSSRKERLAELETEAGEKVDTTSVAAKELSAMKAEIAALTKELETQKLTLGQYLYRLYQQQTEFIRHPKQFAEVPVLLPVRRRKTGRKEHYQVEFERIASVQELPADLREKFSRILFFQRPLRVQRHTVGWCTLEKGRPYYSAEGKQQQGHRYRRCLEGHPAFERFRALALLNNLRVSTEPFEAAGTKQPPRLAPGEGRALTPEERERLLDTLYYKTQKSLRDALTTVFGKKTPLRFNFRDSDNAPMMPTTAGFRKLHIPEAEWQTALNALVDFDDIDRLIAWAQKRWNFTEKDALAFVRIAPSVERVSYSLHAINKILPYLKRGFNLKKAIFCGNLEQVVPDFAANQEAVLEGLAACEAEYAQEKQANAQAWAGNAGSKPRLQPLTERYRAYLAERWGVDQAHFEQLYVDVQATDTEDAVLPPVDLGSIRNPLVSRSLTMLRRLLNTLRREGKIDAQTHIFIELARNVNDANRCRAIDLFQKEQAQKRQQAVEELKKMGKTPTDDLILRYLLREEQGKVCVYTGQPIDDDALCSYDIEHTIPRSRGGSNELSNLTLCNATYNRHIKCNRLPSECPNANAEWSSPELPNPCPPLSLSAPIRKWQQELEALNKALAKKPARGDNPEQFARRRQAYLLKQLQRDYLRAKLKGFTLTAAEMESSGFAPRQLVDTGIITKRAVAYLRLRYPYVYSRNGAVTASARKAWGIQAEEAKKERTAHIHHAVDACVIAALDNKTFAEFCARLKVAEAARSEAPIPPPFAHFKEHIERSTQSLLVRHLPTNCQLRPFYLRTARLPHDVRVRLQAEGRPLPSLKTLAVRGSLHDDTLYERIKQGEEVVTTSRKDIQAQQTKADLEKLFTAAADKALGTHLAAQLQHFVDVGVPANQLPFQTYRHPNGLPVRHLRVVVSKPSDPKPLRPQMEDCADCVYSSGSDALYLELAPDTKEKYKPQYVTLLAKAKEGAATLVPPPADAFRIYVSQMVLIYDQTPEELKQLSATALAKRLYVVQQVQYDGRIYLRYHQEARGRTQLTSALAEMGLPKSGVTEVNTTAAYPFLCLSMGNYLSHCCFEGKDFVLTLDGRIEWLKHD